MITDFSQLDLNKKYTYADYLTWQFSDRLELIRGWVKKMSPAPASEHQRISSILHTQIGSYLRKKKCQLFAAPFDVRLIDKKKSTPDNEIITVVQPDLCIICDETKIDSRGCLGAPDWIIEILSPGNTKTEMQDKYELYAETGVQEYWIVQPGDQTVLCFKLNGEQYSLTGMYTQDDVVPVLIFPDLQIDFREVF